MFNDEEIDKTPTVIQIKAIIKYLEDDQKVKYDFTYMMDMNRIEPNKILLNLNDAYNGNKFEILFNDQDEIVSFVDKGYWIS